jgi:hypothetical protein
MQQDEVNAIGKAETKDLEEQQGNKAKKKK